MLEDYTLPVWSHSGASTSVKFYAIKKKKCIPFLVPYGDNDIDILKFNLNGCLG
jgi:hypothetical protein